jgi:hypothetical protein
VKTVEVVTMHAKWMRLVVLGLGTAALSLAQLAIPDRAPAMPTSEVTEQPPATSNDPSGPSYQLITPTPGTGTIVVPPMPGAAPGSPGSQYCIVYPGPNPSQNTDIGIAQQVQNCAAPGTSVTVDPVR